MGGDRRDTYNSDRAGDRLTIAEAATLLGVHKNTIRNRIKDGTYKAEKVITKRGPTYLIERESLLTNLSTNTLSSASQQLVSPQAMEFVQELLRPFVSELGEVREQLGTERARREVVEERVRELEAELEALREQAREAPGVPESAAKASEGQTRPAAEEAQEPAERPQQRSRWRAPVNKLPWWHYVLGLFLVALAAYLSLVVAWMPMGVRNVIFLVVGLILLNVVCWSVPGVFGVWVGFRRTNPHRTCTSPAVGDKTEKDALKRDSHGLARKVSKIRYLPMR